MKNRMIVLAWLLAACLIPLGCAKEPVATSEPETKKTALTPVRAIVSKSGVYVRVGSGKNRSVVTKLDKGHRLAVVGWSDDYWKILPPEGCRFAVPSKDVRASDDANAVIVQSERTDIYALREMADGKVRAVEDPCGMAVKGETIKTGAALDGEWVAIEPPSRITLFISMDCVTGSPVPLPTDWDGLGADTPQKLLSRAAAAVRSVDQKGFAACLDPGGAVNSEAAGVTLQNTHRLIALQEKAATKLGKDSDWDLTTGFLGMLTMVSTRWFDDATVEVSGDTAKASYEAVDKDGGRSKSGVSLIRRNGKWFLGMSEGSDQIEVARTMIMMRRVAEIISGAEKKLAEKPMTMKKLHMWCRDQVWKSFKTGEFRHEYVR